MNEPTTKQLEVLTYLREYAAEHGAPPTLRDLCKHFGWASNNTPLCHLKSLQRKGLVRFYPNRSRGWVAVNEERAA
jgi:repressor LexA